MVKALLHRREGSLIEAGRLGENATMPSATEMPDAAALLEWAEPWSNCPLQAKSMRRHAMFNGCCMHSWVIMLLAGCLSFSNADGKKTKGMHALPG